MTKVVTHDRIGGKRGAANMGKTRLVLAFTGAALLLAGLWRGEYAVTMNKAVRICLECIGIG